MPAFDRPIASAIDHHSCPESPLAAEAARRSKGHPTIHPSVRMRAPINQSSVHLLSVSIGMFRRRPCALVELDARPSNVRVPGTVRPISHAFFSAITLLSPCSTDSRPLRAHRISTTGRNIGAKLARLKLWIPTNGRPTVPTRNRLSSLGVRRSQYAWICLVGCCAGWHRIVSY